MKYPDSVSCPDCWQYYVPSVGAGLIEISKIQTVKRDREHVKSLLRIKIGRQRLPSGTMVYPYFTLAGVLLRERAINENLPIDDRLAHRPIDRPTD